MFGAQIENTTNPTMTLKRANKEEVAEQRKTRLAAKRERPRLGMSN